MGASWADRNSKYCCFEVSTSLILCNKQQWMISWSDCNVTKSGLYMANSNDQFSDWTEKKLQSTSQSQTQTYTKKGHGHCLVVFCISDPLQLSESWWNHYIWEVCSADRWGASKTAVLQLILINRMGPILLHAMFNHLSHNQCFKSWTNRSTKFCLIHHIHLTSCQLTTTSSSTSTTFFRENASTTSRRQKMLFKSLSNPKAWIFMLHE